MGWKAYKPCKGMLKRFRVSATGKVKRGSTFKSHLRSGRSGNMKRRLGRPAIMTETHARNIRLFTGNSGLKPNRIAAQRALRALREAKEAAGITEPVSTDAPVV